MFKWLIGLSLILVPFITVHGQDIRELKSALAFAAMLTIGLLAAHKGYLKKFGNKFVLMLIGYVWLSTMLAPSSGLFLMGMPLMQFWAWKPFCYLLAYFLGIWAIASYPFELKDIRFILNIMVWCGTVMSIFVIIQFFNLDQFFGPNPFSKIHEQGNLAGTIGHPTFVSSYLAMIIPLAIYLRKYWQTVVIAIVVLIVQSQVAIGAMVLSLLFLLAVRGKKQLYASIAILVLLIGLGFGISHFHPRYISDSGRFFEWGRIVRDVNTPIRANVEDSGVKAGKYPITGRGLGSFYYTYHLMHKANDGSPSGFYQAHNEYLEWLYNCGIVGLILLLLAIFQLIKENWRINWYRNCILSSFFCVAVSAGGTFVWQLGAIMIYSAVIVGLLQNKECEYGYCKRD